MAGFLRIWATVWAVVTGVSILVAPLLGPAPLPLRTLVISGIVVAVLQGAQRLRKVR